MDTSTQTPSFKVTELNSTSPNGFVTTLFTVSGKGGNINVVNSFHINLDLSNNCSWDWKPFYQPDDTTNYLPPPTPPSKKGGVSPTYQNTVIPGFGQPVPSSSIPSLYGPLNTDKVYLVDYNATTGNMLFRGNIPTTPGMTEQSIDFKNLYKCFNQRLNDEGVDITLSNDNYNLIIVPLINSKGEGLSVEAEALDCITPPPSQNLTPAVSINDSGFNKVQLLWWEIWADITKEQTIKNLASTLTDLINTKDKGISLGNDPAKGKRIIYIHCANGDDRTGICASTYLKTMYDKVITADQAYVYGTTVSQWNPPEKYSGGTQYCRNLIDLQGKSIKNKSRIYPSRPGQSTYLQVIEDIVGSIDSEYYQNNASGEGIGFNSFPWELSKNKSTPPVSTKDTPKEGDL